MSHERLFLKANIKYTLEELSIWVDQYGNQKKRKYLFIDEKPKFFSTFSLGKDDIRKFVDMVIDLEKIVSEDLNSAYLEQNLLSLLSGMSLGEVQSINNEKITEIIDRIEKHFWKNIKSCQNVAYPEYFSQIRRLFSGNLYRGRDKYKGDILTVGRTANFAVPGYCTIILDGTAKGDMIYPSDVAIIDIPDYRTYKEVTIWHDSHRNLSKSYLRGDNGQKTKEVFLDLADDITRISLQGKTLVVCSVEHEDVLRKILPTNENIAIAHFNAIKGSNDYLDCTNLFFAGTIDFGDSYYILKALAINASEVTSIETYNEGKKHLFFCEFINQVERNDKEKYILQDLFRIAIRKADNKEPINIYLFQTDRILVQNIAKHLSGCTVQDWSPPSYRKRIAPVETKFIKYLQDNLMNKGDKITKKQIEADLDLSKDYRIELSKKEHIVETLKSCSIEEYTRVWIKTK